MTDVDVMIVVDDAGTLSKLVSGWVYWKEQGTFNVLRANAQGLIFKLQSGDPNLPASYSVPFTSVAEQDVGVYFSEGAKPLPQALVEPLLRQTTVPVTLSSDLASLGPVHVSPGQPTALRRLALARIDIGAIHISLTAPADEPALLVTTFELLDDPNDPYYLKNLSQGAAIFASTNTVRENGVAPAAPIDVRARPRGIQVAGSVPAAATGAKLKLFNAQGTQMSMLSNGSDITSAPVTELPLTLGAASGKERPFTGEVFLPVDVAFGPVQLVIEPQGLTPAHVAGFSFLLVGAQVALVDDFPAGATGATPGTVTTAADEVVVVDFTASPEVLAGDPDVVGSTVRAAQQAHARARRQLRFPIQMVNRPSAPPPGTTPVGKSQMPFLMAELQLLGAERSALEDLMRQREQRAKTPQSDLKLGLEWTLNIDWPTPDRADTSPFLQPTLNLTDKQEVVLKLDTNADAAARKLDGANSGKVPGAFVTPPAALPFPEAGRRVPSVLVSEPAALAQRGWGRHGGTNQPCAIIEWQPIITTTGTATGTPIIRGGNVQIALKTLSIAGSPVPPGVQFPRPTLTGPTPATARASAPPATAPVVFVPHFRIHGLNPPRADLLALVDAVTASEFAADRATRPYLDFIPLAFWQLALRGICTQETNGRQFATPGQAATGAVIIGRGPAANRRTFAHGKERDMPIFGAPHGYGLGQLDPPANIDQLWQIEAAVLGCVRIFLRDKASAAQTALGTEFATATVAVTPLTSRLKNIFLRESVRRFNSGSEFVRNAANTDWEVLPSSRGAATIFYPDHVLGTTMAYETQTSTPNERQRGAPKAPAPASPPRLAFTSAHFVPGL